MKKSEHSQKPTDANSLEPIWREKEIDALCCTSNDRYKDNSLDATLRFLHDAKIKAARGNFIDIIVDSGYDPGDSNSLSRSYIVVAGWREETPAEHHNRLEHLKAQATKRIRDAERVKENVKIYRGTLNKIQVALDKEKDLTLCLKCGSMSDNNSCKKCLTIC